MFIFYVFVAALIWDGVSYWLHKNKPLKNAGEVQQVYLIITSISVIIIALIILVFLIYMMVSSKSLDNLSWAIICILVIAVAALFFKENKI
ncbi:hypothetical protein FTN78_chr0156 [Lactococcus lactis subsp. lactis bv. diacetylactis]|uniref:hypothetical protein n=1 Tax=Lactococcus lactis TaxID=1358 RepID=UPI0012494811|nr:hypothetical protein [Lactococcus lactis]QEX47874.1 hypothetical protein FTN78_chr0156 [Lactococcus lactis subsp. lactis bv. diacetylactis]